MNKENDLFVCIEKQCQNLIMTKMRHLRSHNGHRFITFDDFASKYEERVIRSVHDKKNSENDPFDLMKKKIFEQLNALIDIYITNNKSFDQILNDILEEWRKEDRQSLKKYEKAIREIWISEEEFKQKRNQEIQAVLQSLQDVLDGFAMTTEKVSQSYLSMTEDETQNSLLSLYQSIKKEPSQNLQEQLIETDPQQQQPIQTGSYSFSNELKHQDIFLLSPKRIKSANSDFKFALMQIQLEKNGQIQKFGFNRVQGMLNVFFGVCHLDVVRRNQWKCNFQKLGHGSYMICNNGVVQSTSNKEYNNVGLSFTFTTNTPVHCYFNPMVSMLTFVNKQTQEHYSLEIQQTDDPLYPCVVMRQEDDQVELIDLDDIPDYHELFN